MKSIHVPTRHGRRRRRRRLNVRPGLGKQRARHKRWDAEVSMPIVFYLSALASTSEGKDGRTNEHVRRTILMAQ